MKSDLANSPTLKRLKELRAQARTNRAARKAAWTRRRNPKAYADLTKGELDELEKLQERVVEAKALKRLGGSEEAVKSAQAEYDARAAALKQVRREAAEESQILEVERKLLDERIAAATGELEAEAAEHMRGAVTNWLATLAAFIEANDALHAAELAVEDAGATPPIRAARKLSIETPVMKSSVPDFLKRAPQWGAYYAAELEKHRALSARTHLLKREHDAAAAAAARLAEIQASRAKVNALAAEAAERAAAKQQRRAARGAGVGFFNRSRG